MTTFIIFSFLSVGIRSRAAVFRGTQLLFNPLSEEGDPAVDSVFPAQSALITKTVVADENMLDSTLVSQRTSRVSLAMS